MVYISDSNSDSPLLNASSAEREANKRIAAAGERIASAEKAVDQNINQIKDQFERQRASVKNKQETLLETEKTQGYQNIRDLKRAQEAELRKTLREGENRSDDLQSHYRDKLSKTVKQNEGQLRDIQLKGYNEFEFEKTKGQEQISNLKTENEEAIKLSKKEGETQLENSIQANKDNFEKLKAQSEEEKLNMTTQFGNRVNQSQKDYQTILNNTYSKADVDLQSIRRDTAEKLAAYAARQEDPFYKLVNLDTELHDLGDHFLIVAHIPSHEHDHLSVSLRGETLMISGNRKNEEKLESEPGHTQRTASFQSYNETIPLSWPVEPQSIRKQFDGDTLLIQLTKKNEFVFRPPPKPIPEKFRVEPPHFPDNLVVAKKDFSEPLRNSDGTPLPRPASPEKGSGTLS